MPDAASKIIKPDGKPVTDIEKQIAGAISDLSSNSEIKQTLRELHIVGVKEFEAGNKKTVVVFVPVPQLKAFHSVHDKLVRELEKKLGNRSVLLVARRRILPKPQRGTKRFQEKQKRPRSRTLTTVHEAILNDIVFPAEIIGKRTRVKLDGKRVIKVHLDKSASTEVEHKIDTFASVYKQLTGKDVSIEFHEAL